MTRRKPEPEEREYEVRVREIHELTYTVRAHSPAEAEERIQEDPAPITNDAHVDEILSVKEASQ